MLKVEREQSVQDKLYILADAAKYDVSCTSSGVERRGAKGALGNSRACGICHSFAADGRCISLLKILMTNHCVFDCKYCMNRKSNDIPRATFSPQEICDLTVEFYKRNYIEGLFLSSGVLGSPATTMERMCETLYLLRHTYHFRGYIHVKAIPGAPDDLLAMAGLLADRISINMELPTEESLRSLAPHKSFTTILSPMHKIQSTIAAHRVALGKQAQMERSTINGYLPGSIFRVERGIEGEETAPLALPQSADLTRPFAPAGQSTQMMIGASGESDFQLLMTSQRLYQSFDLKRVFYSAYIPLNEDSALPNLDTPVPLLREHRLYQADWLLRFYGFHAEELLSAEDPFFDPQMDPKCHWAVRHLEQFPVEVSRSSMEVLLRVPGIGPKSAKRIVQARRYATLSFDDLKKMGVVLKRAHYFITCNGKMLYHIPIEQSFITRQLVDLQRKEQWQVVETSNHRQMSLFDDFGVH